MYYNNINVEYARKLRKEMTPWERKLWYNFLNRYPVRFHRQKPIGEYIVDFYCAKAGLIIELDGGGHYNPVSHTVSYLKYLISNKKTPPDGVVNSVIFGIENHRIQSHMIFILKTSILAN